MLFYSFFCICLVRVMCVCVCVCLCYGIAAAYIFSWQSILCIRRSLFADFFRQTCCGPECVTVRFCSSVWAHIVWCDSLCLYIWCKFVTNMNIPIWRCCCENKIATYPMCAFSNEIVCFFVQIIAVALIGIGVCMALEIVDQEIIIIVYIERSTERAWLQGLRQHSSITRPRSDTNTQTSRSEIYRERLCEKQWKNFFFLKRLRSNVEVYGNAKNRVQKIMVWSRLMGHAEWALMKVRPWMRQTYKSYFITYRVAPKLSNWLILLAILWCWSKIVLDLIITFYGKFTFENYVSQSPRDY